jgi:hypothetical protein
MPTTPKPETIEGQTVKAVDPATSCSPADLLPWVIAELRAKHAEAEALMIDRLPQQKHALNEFNVFAFNNVPFLADRCEALMKANT